MAQEDHYPPLWKALIADAKRTGLEGLKGEDDHPPVMTPTLPPWIDPKAVKAGKEFVSRHFFVVFFTHFISLILLLSYVPVRMVLLRTRRSHTTDLALKRYVSTLTHVKLWYEGDLTSPGSEAVQDVVKVRGVHLKVSKSLERCLCPSFRLGAEQNKKQSIDSIKSRTLLDAVHSALGSEPDENNNKVPSEDSEISPKQITQLDMIVTQYCFMGLITSFPQKFGISLDSSPQEVEGLKGFMHIWAVIGHLLGIEDRFNLCVGDMAELRSLILNEILLKDLGSAQTETVVLWESLVRAMSTFVPCLSLHAALLYILEYTMEIDKCGQIFRDSVVYDEFCYYFTIFIVNFALRSGVVRAVFNGLLRFAIFVTSSRLGLVKMIIRTV